MWTRLNPANLRRVVGSHRTPQFGAARERAVQPPSAVQRTAATVRTYYDILGVDATASVDDIKSAFRRQAKLVHPDVSKSVDSEEEFKQLKEAYDTLSDAEQRAEYDDALQRAARRGSSRGAGSSRGHVVVVEDFGLGDFEVVVEGFDSDDDDDSDDEFDDDDDDDDDGFLREYTAWAATPGNMRSSYQSSWQANERKARRAAQQQQAAMRAQLGPEDKVEVLRELPPQARAAAQQVFGSRLQSLNNLEELAEVLDAVMEMNALGIQFEFVDEAGDGRQSARGGGGGGGGGGGQRRRGGGGGGGAGRGGGGAGGAGGRGRARRTSGGRRRRP